MPTPGNRERIEALELRVGQQGTYLVDTILRLERDLAELKRTQREGFEYLNQPQRYVDPPSLVTPVGVNVQMGDTIVVSCDQRRSRSPRRAFQLVEMVTISAPREEWVAALNESKNYRSLHPKTIKILEKGLGL